MPQQIDDLPPGLTIGTLQATLNDRIKVLNLILNGLMTNPADKDLDMANFLIHNLADPVADLDAVNLRTLRRQGGGSVSSTAPTASTSGGLDAYTIVFNVPGFLGPDELVPAYVVGRNREGAPAEAWVYALGAPAVAPCAYQLTQNGSSILATPGVLALGSVGPAFTLALLGGLHFKRGDVIEMLPISGDASGLSVGLVVERN